MYTDRTEASSSLPHSAAPPPDNCASGPVMVARQEETQAGSESHLPHLPYPLPALQNPEGVHWEYVLPSNHVKGNVHSVPVQANERIFSKQLCEHFEQNKLPTPAWESQQRRACSHRTKRRGHASLQASVRQAALPVAAAP